MRSLSCVVLTLGLAMPAGAAVRVAAAASSVPVWLSSDRQFVLATSVEERGLRLLDTSARRVLKVSDQPHTAPFASISPDERYVCYKAFQASSTGGMLQVPTLYDLREHRNIALAAPAPMTGTPAASPEGRIAFTVGRELVLLSADLTEWKRVALPVRANLAAWSADGTQLALACDGGGLLVGPVDTLAFHPVAAGETAASAPRWSPDGLRLAFQSAGGRVLVVEAASGAVTSAGEGEQPGWLDADTVGYVHHTVVDGEVATTEVLAAGGRAAAVPVYTEPGELPVVIGSGGVALGGSGQVAVAFFSHHAVHMEGVAMDGEPSDDLEALDAVDGSADDLVKLSGVPYIHQAYDVPSNFDGRSACGATSSIMAMQYSGILPAHRITCASPKPHTSDFGWYVSETYTFNGHTFDIGSADPRGHIGHGGFGYITQKHWEDTRNHLAEYIADHGRSSGVDWAASMDKARAEIDAKNPFVVLTSLTKSGHYICCIGYSKAHQTLVFNDPWGNKNLGYPNDKGAGATYDWPGQNNGHQNLNTVHCFLWCRPPATPPAP